MLNFRQTGFNLDFDHLHKIKEVISVFGTLKFFMNFDKIEGKNLVKIKKYAYSEIILSSLLSTLFV